MQNINNSSNEPYKTENEAPTFEVDSIELANPKLFFDDEKIDSENIEKHNEQTPELYENSNFKENHETKEPEMFENSNNEDDFEIPAFLRRQKN